MMKTIMTNDFTDDSHLGIRDRLLQAFSADNEKDIGNLLQFLNRGTELQDTDLKTNLIILTKSDDEELEAHLQVAPNLKDLPPIERTGTSSPYMFGPALGLIGDFITNAELQRVGSLFLCKESLRQARLSILAHILKLTPLLETDEREMRTYETTCDKMKARFHIVWEDQEIKELFGIDFSSFLHAWQIAVRSKDYSLASSNNWPSRLAGFSIEQYQRTDFDNRIIYHYLYPAFRHAADNAQKQFLTLEQLNLLENFIVALIFSCYITINGNTHFGMPKIKQSLDEPAKEIELVMQGVGDLSMNEWNVGFYKKEAILGPEVISNAFWNEEFIIPKKEPYSERIYNCLICWDRDADSAVNYIQDHQAGISIGKSLSITTLKIAPGSPIRLADISPEQENDSRASELDNSKIKFAIYGKLLVKNGEVEDKATIAEQFQDVRHLFSLPNLNPRNIQQQIDNQHNKVLDILCRHQHLLRRYAGLENLCDSSDHLGIFRYSQRLCKLGRQILGDAAKKKAHESLAIAYEDLVSNIDPWLHYFIGLPARICG